MKLQPIWVMLRIGFLVGIFIGCCFFVRAQNPLVKQWDKRFGGTNSDFLSCFQQTFDGGYILGGYSSSDINGDKTQPNWDSTGGTFDYWIIKTDSMGNKQWDKAFGGTYWDHLYSIQQTDDGGYILGGYSYSDSSGDKTQANRDASLLTSDYWIVKLDSLGNEQWNRVFGGTGEEELFSIQATADGGYILGGYSFSDSSGDKTEANWDTSGLTADYWIIKTDSLGNKQWDKNFGGNDIDELYSIQQTSDGGYILGGRSLSSISGDKTQNSWGYFDYWIVKTDSLGNKQWDKDFGGTSLDWLNSIQQTVDGGYILGGYSGSNSSGDKTQNSWGYWDYWIVKTDSLGNKQWDKDFGGTANDEFFSIQQTVGGGYLLSGDSYSSISGDKTENNLGFEQTWILKIDSFGSKQWDKTIFTTGHDETGLAIETREGCYAVVNFTGGGIGGYKTQVSQGSYDYWIIKFCDTSQVAPVINLMSTDTTFCEKHCIDFYDLSTNNPTSWQWFFPGADSITSTLQNPTNICYNTYGSFDVTLIACNAAGCDTLVLPGFINEYQTLTPTITQSNDTLFSSPGVAYQWWSVDSGIITGAINSYYIPTQGGSYYVMVTDTNGCDGASNTIVIMGMNEEASGKRQMAIAPNPNNGTFTLTLNTSLQKDFSLSIINTLGQTIIKRQEAKGKGQNAIDVNMDNVAPGLYVVEVINDGKVYRSRLIVE